MRKETEPIYIPLIDGSPVILNTDLFPFYEILETAREQMPYYQSEELLLADVSDITKRLLKEEDCAIHIEALEKLEISPITEIEQFCKEWNIFELIEKGM